MPIEAEVPADWRIDPWTVVDAAIGNGYVGGWTALHYWDLTDQIFGTTVYLTTNHVPHREQVIGGARFAVRHVGSSIGLTGTKRVWRGRVAVDVSNRERTIVDCLDDPSIGGGIRHLAEAIQEYASSERADWPSLVEYGDLLGNRTVFKRLGLLAEELELPGMASVIEACQQRVSAGVGRLDPARPASGPVVRRWMLRRNVTVGG